MLIESNWVGFGTTAGTTAHRKSPRDLTALKGNLKVGERFLLDRGGTRKLTVQAGLTLGAGGVVEFLASGSVLKEPSRDFFGSQSGL